MALLSPIRVFSQVFSRLKEYPTKIRKQRLKHLQRLRIIYTNAVGSKSKKRKKTNGHSTVEQMPSSRMPKVDCYAAAWLGRWARKVKAAAQVVTHDRQFMAELGDTEPRNKGGFVSAMTVCLLGCYRHSDNYYKKRRGSAQLFRAR